MQIPESEKWNYIKGHPGASELIHATNTAGGSLEVKKKKRPWASQITSSKTGKKSPLGEETLERSLDC